MKINDELFDYFKQAGTIKHYQKNDIIYMQDDHADELCLVLKGRVRVYHITKNGDEINYDVLDKGRIFGESSLYENAYRPTTVSAINDVEIITCHLEDLYPYLSSSLDLTITLLKIFNENCNHLTQLFFYDNINQNLHLKNIHYNLYFESNLYLLLITHLSLLQSNSLLLLIHNKYTQYNLY